ncbi:MAG: hypothetical protein KC493_15900 [Bacteriovoracaceae bacterium]|nr:hypothetical protein [Bacteriovoracaceae bacterium]
MGSLTHAAYYETVPKKVRLLAVRQVYSGTITNFFEANMKSESLGIKAEIDADALKSVQALDEFYFETLERYAPDAYDKFSAGKWELDAKAKAKVFGVGFAYGITDRLMAVASLPYYDVRVMLEAKRTAGNNYEQVANIIRSGEGRLRGLSIDTSDFPDPTGELIQSVLVNYYGYAPGGEWRGKGYGDLDLFAKYRLTDWRDKGLAVALGVIVPTGREQDEDILQDVSFGNGYWSTYAEFGGGVRLSPMISLDSWIRGSYNFERNITKRIPEGYDFLLSSEKGNFKEKPGHRIDYSLSSSFQINDWWTITPEYLYSFLQSTEYESQYTLANSILSYKSEEEAHTAKLGVEFSTITPFMKGKMAVPFSTTISVEQTMVGKNVPDLFLASLELRLMF